MVYPDRRRVCDVNARWRDGVIGSAVLVFSHWFAIIGTRRDATLLRIVLHRLRDGVDKTQFTPWECQNENQSLVAAVLLGGMLASPAFAANSQQDKMKACNTQAAGKTGDERKAFMKDCLSAKPAKKMTQQEKMKACNTQAADKKGDDRKAFMKSCLSSQPAA